MDSLEIARILVRRWYVTLVGIVLLVITLVTVSGRIDPVYESTTDLLMLVPTAAPDATAESDLSFSLPALGSAGISLARSDNNLRELAREGLSTDFEIEGDREGAIFVITARGATPEQTVATVERVVILFEDSIQQVQRNIGADEETFATTRSIRPASIPRELTDDKTKALAATTGVGLVMIVVFVLSLNALLELRIRRQARTGEPPDEVAIAVEPEVDSDEPRLRRWGA